MVPDGTDPPPPLPNPSCAADWDVRNPEDDI